MTRSLTQGECGLVHSVFGAAIRTGTVRFVALPFPLTRAFVPGSFLGLQWVGWPQDGLADDVSMAPVSVQAVFIHEMVHVWQSQCGVNLLTGKIRAGDGPAAYHYPVDDHCQWGRLNIEQQAMIVEHRFRHDRGQTVPASRDFYDRICPLG